MKELYGNGYVPIIAQAIEEMKAEQGDSFSLERINLAELERRTGISRGKLNIPSQWCGETAPCGAQPPLKWCIHSA